MPLTNVQIRPGFNKQVTATGAEGQVILFGLDMDYPKK